MTRSAFSSRPKTFALLFAIPVFVIAVLASSVGSASAHHLYVKGSADCTATVKFQIDSWSDTKGGENKGVMIDYRVDNGDWKRLGNYPLLMENNNKASGSFKIEDHTKAMEVDLRASTTTKWGNDVKMDDTKYANDIKVPAPCVEPAKPSASLTSVDCTVTKSVVTLKNDGGSAIDFTINKDGSLLQKVNVAAKSTKTVEINVDKAMKISISADKMTTVEKTLTPATDCVKPSAAVKVVCDTKNGSGAVITLTNNGKVADTFTVSRDGKTVGNPVKVEAGKSTKVLVSIGEDATSTITVTSTGGLNFSQKETLDCVEVPPTVAPTTIVPTTVPPVTEAPAEVQEVQLAKTGVESMPLAMLGFLLVALGAGTLRSRSLLVLNGKHFT